MNNSIVMYKFPKTLHPGEIRTNDLLVLRMTRWPLCHAVTGSKKLFRFKNDSRKLEIWVQIKRPATWKLVVLGGFKYSVLIHLVRLPFAIPDFVIFDQTILSVQTTLNTYVGIGWKKKMKKFFGFVSG
jgi:hypothetical protein